MADKLVRRRSLRTACFGVFQDHMQFVGPMPRARRCAPEGIPPAAVVFVSVSTESRFPGQAVWLVVPHKCGGRSRWPPCVRHCMAMRRPCPMCQP